MSSVQRRYHAAAKNVSHRMPPSQGIEYYGSLRPKARSDWREPSLPLFDVYRQYLAVKRYYPYLLTLGCCGMMQKQTEPPLAIELYISNGLSGHKLSSFIRFRLLAVRPNDTLLNLIFLLHRIIHVPEVRLVDDGRLLLFLPPRPSVKFLQRNKYKSKKHRMHEWLTFLNLCSIANANSANPGEYLRWSASLFISTDTSFSTPSSYDFHRRVHERRQAPTMRFNTKKPPPALIVSAASGVGRNLLSVSS